MTENHWIIVSLMVLALLFGGVFLYSSYIAHWWPFALPTYELSGPG